LHEGEFCEDLPVLDLKGSTVSAAARPESSVPWNAKAAVTNTEHIPLNPFRNDPGSCQNVVPYLIPLGDPPASMTIPRIINPMTAATLIPENRNSASPYPRTPARLINTTATQKIVMNIALLI
jgi:hypothetical protein